MEIQGTFKPPPVGATAMPIPINGEGRILLTPNGIDAHGFVLPKNPLVPLVFAAVILGIPLFAVLKTTVFASVPQDALTSVALGAAGVLVAFVLRGTGAKKQSAKPLTLSIPWTSVKKVARDPHNPECLVISVKKFKPRGNIHFAPRENLDGAITALSNRVNA